MTHIKCKYKEIYCGDVIHKMNRRAVLCDPSECGEGYESEWVWVAGESVGLCKCAYPDTIEFEKTVRGYEFNKAENTLKIGTRLYQFIEYLEIDGRVLVGGEDNEQRRND